MDTIGGNAKTSLWNDANSETPTISGSAYKVLLDASNQSKPDFKNDPIMNLSKSTYDDIDLIAQGFGDCSAETVIKIKQLSHMCPTITHVIVCISPQATVKLRILLK